jgi:hypothetical protein
MPATHPFNKWHRQVPCATYVELVNNHQYNKISKAYVANLFYAFVKE